MNSNEHPSGRAEDSGPSWDHFRPYLVTLSDATIGAMAVTVASGRTRRVLVVSPSEARRGDWAAVVQDGRTAVETCSGPAEQCVLLRGFESCPLVAGCDVVLYDFDATTPSFLAVLLRAHRAAEVVLVRDRVVRGQHRPSVVLRRRPRGTAFDTAL